MKTQRGFASAVILIAIVLGLVVPGVGAYYVMQQSPSPTPSENNFVDLQTLPTTNTQTQQPTNVQGNGDVSSNTAAVQLKTYRHPPIDGDFYQISMSCH
jgi:hypothetical protein